MQRVTLTLDDDLLAALDALSTRRGYHNRSDCLEIAVLKGDMAEVQHFADDVIAQRGVRHGHLQCLADEN
ncbi:hypothetical protein BME52_12580 [Klebsiella pneumoniae]|uniref:ribbon-helix-helix protein, CopG family n=1 Tax=Klebsiella pneumoniae TaxID=573 RepID=UPI000B40A781|nr:ribbon-helix-helix protein, CopG family [Klebsiella pneumoniae]OVW34764.1 hypothetical protein BME52_12580 [Klebsiella pneumoniae]